MKIRFISIFIAALMGLCLTAPVSANTVNRYAGKSMSQWSNTYWQWYYGSLNVPVDANGNAVVDNKVVLMSMPATPGDGTPGFQNVTLYSGQGFVLPFWAIMGQIYENSVDKFQDYTKYFPTLDLKVQLDGKTVIDSKNLMKFYYSGAFNPPIPIPYDPANPALAQKWFQEIGILDTPLSVGQHTIVYHGKNTEPFPGGYVVEYNNTWTIDVIDKGKNHSVPEPATMLLLGLGLMGLAGFRRKFSN